MMTEKMMLRSLGDEPPLLADGSARPTGARSRCAGSPDVPHRHYLVRLDGCRPFCRPRWPRELATPAEAYASVAADAYEDTTATPRSARLISPAIAAKPSDRAVMEVPTVVIEGDNQVVRNSPSRM